MKAKHYDEFKAGIVRVCDSLVPSYKAAMNAKKLAPNVQKQDKLRLRKYLSSSEFVAAVFFAGLAQRYATFGTKQVDLNSDDTFDALRELAPYCAVYGSYLRELLTAGRKPDDIDWGDLELFMYLQPNSFVVTAEKRWCTIAELAGLGARVRRLIPKLL